MWEIRLLTVLPSACIISIVRLFYLKISRDSHDPTWDSVPATYWTVIELNCGILCACLPTLRPLLRHIFPSLAHNSEKDSGGPKDSNGQRIITIGESDERRRKPVGLYTLTTASEAGTSREELRTMSYDAGEHAGHPGPTSKLSTAIYGGRGWSGDAPVGNEQRITVTRELGMKESLNGR